MEAHTFSLVMLQGADGNGAVGLRRRTGVLRQQPGQQAVHDDVWVAPDGRGEVRVHGHRQRIVPPVSDLRVGARAEILGLLHTTKPVSVSQAKTKIWLGQPAISAECHP